MADLTAKNTTTYEATFKEATSDLAQTKVVIGGSDTTKFIPNVNASKWNDECFLNINFGDIAIDKETQTFTDVQVLRDTYVTWSEISAEIEAGRPVIMVGYGANHFFVVKGITQNPQTLTVLWGHVPEVRTYTRAQIIAMGPLEAFYIRPVAVDPPDDLPQEQAWWPEVSQWMGLNGWEMVRK